MAQTDEDEPCEKCGSRRFTAFVATRGTRRDRMVVCEHCEVGVSRAVFGAVYAVRLEGRTWLAVRRQS